MRLARDASCRSKVARALIPLAVIAVVFSSRAWLAHVWGSGIPFWDEWDVEGLGLYPRWLGGSLSLRSLFASHNEHRIVLTRLADLGLFIAYGHWEPWAQLVLNAGLHAAAAGALVRLLGHALAPLARSAFALLVVAVFVATGGWQNALHGFQSAVYFANLLGVAAIGGLLAARALSLSWWLGWAAAVVSLFSCASGAFAPVAALAVWLPLCLAQTTNRKNWLAAGVLAVVPIVAVLLVSSPAAHAPLHARTPGQFTAVFLRGLSWPWVNSPVGWIALQWPAVALLASVRFRVHRLSGPDRCALALVGLGVVHAAIVAYSRGAGLPQARLLSRYQDPLLPGIAAQAYCALRLAAAYGSKGRLGALGWSAALIAGLIALCTYNLTVNLPYKRAQDTAGLRQIRSYLANHDAAAFLAADRFTSLHPNPEVPRSVIDQPALRGLLPPIFYAREPEATAGLQPWPIRHGRALFAAALPLFVASLAWLGWRSQRPDPPVPARARA